MRQIINDQQEHYEKSHIQPVRIIRNPGATQLDCILNNDEVIQGKHIGLPLSDFNCLLARFEQVPCWKYY